jgi:hypothetical protein
MKTSLAPVQICATLFLMSSPSAMAADSFIVSYSVNNDTLKIGVSLDMGVTPDALFFTTGYAAIAAAKDVSEFNSAPSIRMASQGGSACKVLPVLGPPFKEKLCVTARRSGNKFAVSTFQERNVGVAISIRSEVTITVQEHSCLAHIESLSRSAHNVGPGKFVIPKPYQDYSADLGLLNAAMKCSISE